MSGRSAARTDLKTSSRTSSSTGHGDHLAELGRRLLPGNLQPMSSNDREAGDAGADRSLHARVDLPLDRWQRPISLRLRPLRRARSAPPRPASGLSPSTVAAARPGRYDEHPRRGAQAARQAAGPGVRRCGCGPRSITTIAVVAAELPQGDLVGALAAVPSTKSGWMQSSCSRLRPAKASTATRTIQMPIDRRGAPRDQAGDAGRANPDLTGSVPSRQPAGAASDGCRPALRCGRPRSKCRGRPSPARPAPQREDTALPAADRQRQRRRAACRGAAASVVTSWPSSIAVRARSSTRTPIAPRLKRGPAGPCRRAGRRRPCPAGAGRAAGFGLLRSPPRSPAGSFLPRVVARADLLEARDVEAQRPGRAVSSSAGWCRRAAAGR